MRQWTESRVAYQFSELSESAKNRAVEKQAEFESREFDGVDAIFEDVNRIAKIFGITFAYRSQRTTTGKTYQDPCIYYSGFSSQGDGASFEGNYAYAKGSSKAIRDYAPLDTKLHYMADELMALQRQYFYGLTATITKRGNYEHSGCMDCDVEYNRDETRELPHDDLLRVFRSFADWIYRSLETEYDYRTSRDACIESIEANEYEYDAKGNIL